MGNVVLFRFRQTDGSIGKLRPAILIKKIKNEYADWLVCMVSRQTHQQIKDLEVIVSVGDEDFISSGLKQSSLIRMSRLAVVDEDIFEGNLGSISDQRLQDIKERFSKWILEDE